VFYILVCLHGHERRPTAGTIPSNPNATDKSLDRLLFVFLILLLGQESQKRK
jgi:hypothetical protein